MTTATTEPRQLKPEELSTLVKAFREARQWSQEQLAEIAGLSTRTVQRVEEGQSSSLDTRRALAGAFGFDDIDAFNKPYVIPTNEQMAAEKARFEKERVTLKAVPLESGKQLGKLVEGTSANMFSEAAGMPQATEQRFAQLTDFCREYSDCSDLYSATDKLDVYAGLDDMVADLAKDGFTLVGATREVMMKTPGSESGIRVNIVYVVAFPKGQEAENLAVPRAVHFG
ncbi:helix-turn-helix domain-containing protein [Polaromonas naphthalenivorans]|uniref:HTH cro/C1-type domain-containing protein n=1 Tax=Polaromonas naphthalenivorans (strain CJ2) TaxID=365044 RepID=A1VX63_POLNA|nr:helix-turn-helix transcriptional regulator [Polaromonas naphthalenivorans]ABM40241.1 conserved hypothetical protein [Polaromonas naphthalenivorans CJ2]